MFPMDFEEFLWAIGDEVSAETIRYLIKNKKAAGRYKLFNSDVGLFITLAFKDKNIRRILFIISYFRTN